MEAELLLKHEADLCIRCAACTAICPVSRVTPLFPGPKQAGPGAQRFRRASEPSTDPWIDLCIGCQLCDMVCAAGVPISELNLIAKAKYLDEKGRPLRDWLLTHTHLFGSLGSMLSPLVNFFLNNRAFRWLLDAILKIDRRRALPPYESPTFRQWFRSHRFSGEKKVAYFYGCFTNTNEVDVGKATVEVLEANGFQVILPRQQCCGIPMLGNGNFKGARKMGAENIPPLLEAVRSGLEIVFSSTSCGHMIRHEYGHLLHLEGAEEIAPHLFDLMQFLLHLHDSGQLRSLFQRTSLKVAYFAPCHLKSLGIGFPSLHVLRLVPGLSVENVEAHCCGLGGTFGFKKEKYPISQEIGRDLERAISNLKPDVVLSECEGCRMQIRHLTGLRTLHPVQLLRDALLREEKTTSQ